MSKNLKAGLIVAAALLIGLTAYVKLRGGSSGPPPAPIVYRCSNCGQVLDDLPPEMEAKAKAGQLRCPYCRGGKLRPVPADQVSEEAQKEKRSE